MTESTPPLPSPATVSDERPDVVTGAAITLIVLGILTCLFALLLGVGAGMFAGAAGAAGFDGQAGSAAPLFGAFAGALVVAMLVMLGFGALQIVAGISVFPGRGWARIVGIVVAVIGGVLALAGAANMSDGGPAIIVNLAVAAANAFVAWTLAANGAWFRARPPSL